MSKRERKRRVYGLLVKRVGEGWKLPGRPEASFPRATAGFVDVDVGVGIVCAEEPPPTMGVVEFAEAEEAEEADDPGGDGVRDFFPFPFPAGDANVGDVGTESAGFLCIKGGERIKKLAMTAKKKQISPRVRMVHGQLTSWNKLRVA